MMRFAYADPPYPGQAMKHYGREEVDHPELLHRLCSEFPDGWALSTSSSALPYVLSLIDPPFRIGVWVKPFAIFKPNVGVAYAWEPVIFKGGRKRERSQITVRDWVSCNVTLRKGLVGAKPAKVCRWILDVLNFHSGDELVDLYPGTGIMGDTVAKLG